MDNDSEIVWICMTILPLLTGVLLIFVKVDSDSIRKVSKIGPSGGLLKYKWWRYIVAGMLFCLSLLSFALLKGWIA